MGQAVPGELEVAPGHPGHHGQLLPRQLGGQRLPQTHVPVQRRPTDA